MSCYNWESGEIVIPNDQYRNFRKNLLEAWNERETAILKLAEDTYSAIKEKRLTKQNHDDWRSAVSRFLSGKNEDTIDRVYGLLFVRYEKIEGQTYGKYTELEKPQSPKKKDLAIRPTSKGCGLNFDDCSLALNDETRTLHWRVSENNRAIERAHNHPFAGKLFQALNQIQWKRGSGGMIVGNDEYNRENSFEGGGGNYVRFRFGPNSAVKSFAR